MTDAQKRIVISAATVAMIGVVIVLIMLAGVDGYGVYVCAQLALSHQPLPEPCTNGAISKFGLEIMGAAVAIYGATKMASK